MKHSIRHDIGLSLAQKATSLALDSYKAHFAEYQPSGSWVSATEAHLQFKALGSTLKGTIQVYEDRIDLDLTVPFLFRAFRSTAIGVIENEIKQWIIRVKTGELD